MAYTNNVAHRVIKNPSGYHSKGRTHKEKLHNFAMYIKQFGWTGKWWYDADAEILFLRATHDDNEKIEIEWPDNATWADPIWYTYAGHIIKLRNISHAVKVAQDPPDPKRMRAVARKRRKPKLAASSYPSNGAVARRNEAEVGSEVPATDPALELATSLPFDKESSPEEIKQVLVKKSITWLNSKTGNVNTATIKPRNFKVNTNKDGKIIVNFADEFGFHAVYVDSIIGVG